MDMTVLIVVLLVLFLVAVLIVILFAVSNPLKPDTAKEQVAVSDTLRALVASQRQAECDSHDSSIKVAGRQGLALAAAAEAGESRKQRASGSKLTLEKKLRFARWRISPLQFRAIQLIITLIVIIPTIVYDLNIVLKVVMAFLTPAIVRGVLDMALNKRFKAFDRDYPVLLLQFVSLLKTGMNTITGLEAAGKGLDEDSLVRAEIALLMERLRLGLNEEQAISAFGEDIAHPELELFVQSLLLSRRVGGKLSNTLERLAKQVRKRQQFREQAVAAVGMERGSLYAIAVIMSLLLVYIAIQQPMLVVPAFDDPMGKNMLQGGAAMVLVGFYWSRVVTNIKI